MIEKVSYKQTHTSLVAVDRYCHRCMGNHLAISENNRVYCEDCSMNQSMSDLLYIERYERLKMKKKHILNLNFELSSPQIKGQSFIERCYKDQTNGFLHAVCGAGKTEMTLSTILDALNNSLSIAFVIPRVEIIKQLIVRFQAYFPKTNICGLYQDMSLDETADIYITTPHQLIKFYQEFDLLIIDEVDAFPYYQNDYLYRLVKKSLKHNGLLFYISATMPDDFRELIQRNHFEYCLIPERFHQKDLVIPEFFKYRYLFNNELFENISTYEDNNKKLLIFFPSIHLMSRYYYFLSQKKLICKMISSKTPFKNVILKDFENEGFNILLTTTLLERGITFKNCDAFVLEADHPIFDKETLIQISGRVGRDLVYSGGLLHFYSCYISKAMLRAKAELIKMNKDKNDDLSFM